MDGKSKPDLLDVWIVTDGKQNWFATLEKRPAQLFAEKFNSQMSNDSDRVRVEHRQASLHTKVKP